MLSRAATWYFSKRNLPYWGTLLLDSVMILFAGILTDYLVVGGGQLAGHFWPLMGELCVMLLTFFMGFRLFHTYSGIIRYSGFIDLARVFMANLTGVAITFVLFRLIAPLLDIDTILTFRKMVYILALGTMFLWLIRMGVKMMFENLHYNNATANVPNIFIYGVKEGGIAIAKSINSDATKQYNIRGFVSPDEEMKGKWLLGRPVYLDDDELLQTMLRKDISGLIVSPLLSDHFRSRSTLIDKLLKQHIRIKMMPPEEDWSPSKSLRHTQLHNVEIEDLLPRDKIDVDLNAISRLLKDKVILISGAAGSIGYDMTRQVAKFQPRHLILIDQAETPMHTVRLHMAKHYPHIQCETVVCSISNSSRMEALFSQYRPDYVFHAAAYKHVPMMEDNPAEAVQNNVYGTRVLADLAVKYGTKKFVMISTDKAVNPTNVMGCSKRICEIYCQSLNKALEDLRNGHCDLSEADRKHLLQTDGTPGVTQFITTRFGNVLGSNGSVIPLFKKQIQQGGPLTVTHPDIIRFFMLIPEACRLVLEAGTMGHGGEIFVFDMGQPVKIAHLAQRMIDLSGAKGITIKYTGLREGEKLFEEVLNDSERTKPTVHPKIMVSAVREYPYELALRNEEELYRLSFSYDDMQIVAKMKEIVPEYKSKTSKYGVLDKD